MGTTIGDYIGATSGIHTSIPYYEPEGLTALGSLKLQLQKAKLHEAQNQ